MSRSARIVSTGSYVPEIEVSNDALRERFADARAGVRRQDGGGQRHQDPLVGASRTGRRPISPSAPRRKALDAAGKKPEDVDLVLLGTDSPDFITPATSVVVQHKLGAKNAGTFDVGLRLRVVPDGPRDGRGPHRDEHGV